MRHASVIFWCSATAHARMIPGVRVVSYGPRKTRCSGFNGGFNIPVHMHACRGGGGLAHPAPGRPSPSLPRRMLLVSRDIYIYIYLYN